MDVGLKRYKRKCSALPHFEVIQVIQHFRLYLLKVTSLRPKVL